MARTKHCPKTDAAPLADLARRLGWRLAVAGGLLAPTPLWAEEVVEPAAEAYSEDSVLVATRKVEGEPAGGESSLEPISQPAEASPELADPRPEVVVPPEVIGADDAVVDDAVIEETTAAAETKAVEKPAAEPEPVRVAARLRRPATTADPMDVASAYRSESIVEPAKFHGIVPGESTRGELIEAWGEAEETSPTESGDMLMYDMPPFASVEVLTENELVSFIKVELDTQQQPRRLARRLRLDKFEPVKILDEAGERAVGLAYPEKGMLLLLAEPSITAPAKTPQFVTHMVIQALDPEAFALRADQADFGDFEAKLVDLNRAIAIDADCAYANWQLAELHRLTGAADKAEKAAAAALESDPKSDAYRLCWAECLTDQGEYDTAVLEARKVLDSVDAPSVVKAGALHLMGRLASLGESGIADKAIGFQTMAIDIADTLATSADRAERLRAKRLLIDAHLAVAREISRRKYARKSEIVGQWIGRASGLAEDMINDGDGGIELRLVVARDALAALANLKPAKDPAPWIEEAEEAADKLLAENRDPLFRSRVEWQLGQAYFHALRVEHSRKQVELGRAYGEKSIEHLKLGATTGELRPSAESLVGRLYFHIGALHAVHEQDHSRAINWYNKAEPLLANTGPKSDLAVPRRRGEALVSMAVSYWDQGERDKAVELTMSGSELMENAVAGGVLDEKSLAVPYGNLSTMHRRLGDREESAKYAKLARGARGAEEVKPPTFAEAITRANPSKTAAKPASKSTTKSSGKATDRSAAKPAPAKPATRTASKPKTTAKKSTPPTVGVRQRIATRATTKPADDESESKTKRPSRTRKPTVRSLFR